MMRFNVLVFLAAIGPVLGGCYASAVRDLNAKHDTTLRTRGEFDLDYPKEQLKICPHRF